MELTHLKVHGLEHFIAPVLETVDPEEVRWDGADKATTHKILLQHLSESIGHDIYAYVEAQVTGRKERTQRVPYRDGTTYEVYGIRGRIRFTGADDSGEWIPVVFTE